MPQSLRDGPEAYRRPDGIGVVPLALGFVQPGGLGAGSRCGPPWLAPTPKTGIEP